MKKKVLSAFLLGAMAAAMLTPASAANDFTVTFDEKGLTPSYTADSMADAIFSGMQPGDSATITVTLVNSYEQNTNWYISNSVLESLEDNSEAAGGYYTYILDYIAPDGTSTELFNSDTVGNENTDDGLNAVSGALEDFSYLGVIGQGQTGQVTLTVALDGETQGNSYQDTQAKVALNFAAELTEQEAPSPSPSTSPSPSPSPSTSPSPSPSTSTTPTTSTSPSPSTSTTPTTTVTTTSVKTGDTANLLPWCIAAGAAGVILLVLAITSLKKSKKH